MVGGGLDYSAAFQRAIELIGKRWTGAVVKALLPGPARFNQLLAGIPGITRMHPDAGIQSEALFRGCEGWHARDHQTIRQSNLLQTARHWDTESVRLI